MVGVDLSWSSMGSATGFEEAKAGLWVELVEERRYGMLIANLEHMKSERYVMPAQETGICTISLSCRVLKRFGQGPYMKSAR